MDNFLQYRMLLTKYPAGVTHVPWIEVSNFISLFFSPKSYFFLVTILISLIYFFSSSVCCTWFKHSLSECNKGLFHSSFLSFPSKSFLIFFSYSKWLMETLACDYSHTTQWTWWVTPCWISIVCRNSPVRSHNPMSLCWSWCSESLIFFPNTLSLPLKYSNPSHPLSDRKKIRHILVRADRLSLSLPVVLHCHESVWKERETEILLPVRFVFASSLFKTFLCFVQSVLHSFCCWQCWMIDVICMWDEW